MENIKVSVIIPVFNTEKYVRDAIDCITHQSLSEIEIIIINDGSTDSSLEIIQSLAKEDGRIEVYSQINKGQGAARNEGLKHARGEYIYFMDSDDLLAEDALQQCYEKCELLRLDFLFFDAEVFGACDFHIKFDYRRTHLMNDRIYSGVDAMEQLLTIGSFYVPIWLNFINLGFLKTSGLDFYEGIHCDDELFTFVLYLKAHRVGIIRQAFFKRRIRENSIMTSNFSRQKAACYFIVADQLTKIEKNESSPAVKALAKDRVAGIVNNVLYQSRRLRYKDRLFSAYTSLRYYRKSTSFKNILLIYLPSPARIKKKLNRIMMVVGRKSNTSSTQDHAKDFVTYKITGQKLSE